MHICWPAYSLSQRQHLCGSSSELAGDRRSRRNARGLKKHSTYFSKLPNRAGLDYNWPTGRLNITRLSSPDRKLTSCVFVFGGLTAAYTAACTRCSSSAWGFAHGFGIRAWCFTINGESLTLLIESYTERFCANCPMLSHSKKSDQVFMKVPVITRFEADNESRV